MRTTMLMTIMLVSNILMAGICHAGKWKIDKSQIKDFTFSEGIHCVANEFIHSIQMNNYPDPKVECFEDKKKTISVDEHADDLFFRSSGKSKYIIGFSNHIWGRNSVWIYSLTNGKQLLKIPRDTGLKNCLKSSGFEQKYYNKNDVMVSFKAKGDVIQEFIIRGCEGQTVDVLKLIKRSK